MNQDVLKQFSTAVERLPVFRQSGQRVLALTADTQCKASELIATIYSDPILALQVLKVINSSHYNLSHKVTTVEHALVHMGVNPIKNLLLPFTCKGQFIDDQSIGLDLRQYLLYLHCTAHIAKQLAIELRLSDPTECFVAGLLHDFGKLALAHTHPQEFSHALQHCTTHNTLLRDALQISLQLDYAHISADLMQQWGFSAALVQAVRHQHNVQNEGMNICVFAAIQICKQLHFGFAGDQHVLPFPETVVHRLHGTLDQVISRWSDLDAMFQRIKKTVQA
jgi:HD-like signal output (HDOD) protein